MVRARKCRNSGEGGTEVDQNKDRKGQETARGEKERNGKEYLRRKQRSRQLA